MRRSGLVRDKWDAPGHANYLRNTILKACAVVTGCYTRRSWASLGRSGPAVQTRQRTRR
jgi:hypothetical protein